MEETLTLSRDEVGSSSLSDCPLDGKGSISFNLYERVILWSSNGRLTETG